MHEFSQQSSAAIRTAFRDEHSAVDRRICAESRLFIHQLLVLRLPMIKFAALLITGITLPASAQTSFLGIQLDAPFPGVIATCPRLPDINLVDHARIKDAGMCAFMDSKDNYTVYNTPDLGIGHLLRVETYAEKPEIFRFRFNKEKYSQAVDIFTTRYGKPQKANRETVRTASGQLFQSRSSLWLPGRLKIRLEEIGKDVRWSEGVVVNVSVLNEMRDKNKESAKAAADKL